LQQANICNGWVGQAYGYAANGGCAGRLVLIPQGRVESYHQPLWQFYTHATKQVYVQVPVSVGEQDTLWYTGKDPKFLNGKRTFTRMPNIPLRRDYNLENAGAWANEVWLEASHITPEVYKGSVDTDGLQVAMDMLLVHNIIAIYDHQFQNNMHIWSIGPWSPEAGGERFTDRFAYAVATQDAVQKMKAAIGLTREVESKDVLTIAKICNDWEQPHETYYRGNGGCNGGFDAFVYSTASADRVRQRKQHLVLTSDLGRAKQNIRHEMILKHNKLIKEAQAATNNAARATKSPGDKNAQEVCNIM
jgi:hypothetical protein